MHPCVLLVVRLTYEGTALPRSSSLNAAVEENTQPIIGAV
jgi:hypothetical protein